jgi:phosphoglycerate kinase
VAVKSIKDVDVAGKRVFCRVDFNVPLDASGSVRDDTRIVRALPTVKYAKTQGARMILASHLGRPKGERRPEMSLRPVASRVSELLEEEVLFADDCVGPEASEVVESLEPGGVALLENLRFHPQETKNDPEFARELAALGEVYVNDAFGTAHRAHASTVGVPGVLTVKAAGLLLKQELDSLHRAFADPAKPVVAIFGGAKVSDKLGVLENLLHRMDAVLIGGGMANTFLAANGLNMGASKVEEDMVETAGNILENAKSTGCKVLLPVDLVAADRIEDPEEIWRVKADSVPADGLALDIGAGTVDLFSKEIEQAGTIVWNGPMGVFEVSAFALGTKHIARIIARMKAYSVVGGGDTVRAVQQFGVADDISYISTGGGAFMEFMEGKTLPGVAALEQ